MNALILPILLPLIAAALGIWFSSPRAGRWLCGLLAHGLLGLAAWLLSRVAGGEVAVLRIGAWPEAFGIVLVLDALGAVMLLLSAVGLTLCFWFERAAAGLADASRAFESPLLFILVAGVNGAFLTGDLFNLFVCFELMLLASYGLLVARGNAAALREGVRFVVINVLAGVLFLSTAGWVYARYGTLNLAALSVLVGQDPRPAIAAVLGTLLFVVFGIKAAIFPLYYWLPGAYPKLPLSTMAYFTAILTKVGVYCLYRFQTLVFRPGQEEWFGPLLLTVGSVTMLLGVLGALSRKAFRPTLSFHIISQIGYMIFALGLMTPLAIGAGIFTIAHNVVVKTGLFLVAGALAAHWGTDEMKRLGGVLKRAPVLAFAFLFLAFSLAGLPPTSGFYGKFLLAIEGARAGAWWPVAASLLTSMFTLTCMIKLWAYSFMGEPSEAVAAQEKTLPARLVAVVLVAVALSLGLVIFSGPILGWLEGVGGQLLEQRPYVEAVLGAGGMEVAR